MKKIKLPRLVITDCYSQNPKIKAKVNKFILTVKTLVITTLIVMFAIGAYVVNVQHNMQKEKAALITSEMNQAATGTGIVIDTTAGIIEREGKVPSELAKKYAVWIYDASMKFRVDPVTLLAIMSNESKFNYKAVSPTGPIGLMQVAASWHKDKVSSPGELFDPKKNIFVGAQIVAEYGSKTSTEAEMLVRYNAQPGYAPVYAMKVLATKRKYDNEITEAIVKDI